MTTEAAASGMAIVSIRGVPAERCEAVKAGILAGARDLAGRHEAWVVPARRLPAYVVRMIGPRGYFREVKFTGRENQVEITERIRQTTGQA